MPTQLSPTRYGRNVPKNARSAGAVELKLPLKFLLKQFAVQMLQDSLGHLKKGKFVDDIQRHLEDAGASTILPVLNGTVSSPPDLLWDKTWRGLTRLVNQVADLSNDDGAWRESLTAFLPEISEFEARLRERIKAAVNRIHADHGAEAALRAIAHIDEKVQALLTKSEEYGYPSINDRIRALSTPEKRVRSLLKRPNLKLGFASRVNDRIPVSALFSARQRKQVFKLIDAGNRLQQARFQRLLQPVERNLLRRMIGDEHSTGWLQELKEEIINSKAVFDLLAETLSCQEDHRPTESVTRLLLVDGMETVLNCQSGHTVLEEFRQRARTVGRTSPQLAQYLFKNGVTIDGSRLLPHQWQDVPIQTLSNELLSVTERFLGCHDDRKPLNPYEPKSAADACAQLHILHPMFLQRLQTLLPILVERSMPYAEFQRLQGERKNTQSFLFCDPSHRKRLIEMLSLQTVTIAEGSRAETYATRHPYSLLLLQIQICAALGTMPAVHRWSQLNNRMIHNEQVEPLEKRFRYPEVRMLTERVRDDEDSRTLFNAAKVAGAVVEIESTGRWTIVQSDLRLSELFAPSSWVPRWLSATEILVLLQSDSDFPAFLVGQFLSVRNLRPVLERLKLENNARAVAEELVQTGVLRSKGGRYSLKASFTSKPKRAPRELVQRKSGETTGLTEEMFLTALATHDLLYTTLFFAVMDAWQLNEIATREVPTSIREAAIRL